jgi:heme A synthase
MKTLRRYAYAVFGVACLHLIFGAIVRISGSGMGCGDHWPKCQGFWFPPMSRPDLIIEVSHRYLASILLLSLLGLLAAAWNRRDEFDVGGRGGVLRMTALAVALGFGAAILGAVTVKLYNAPPATVAHWTVAMSLVAAVTAAVIRTGGLGGESARLQGTVPSVARSAFAAATLALIVVVMGGLTAKVPGGSVACLDFPLCGANPKVDASAVHVQLTHRILAVLLILHLFGMLMAQRKKQVSPVVKRALVVAFSLGILQLLVAGAMIGMRLPPVLRSLHEATGVSIWIATFVLAYLARISSGGSAVGARLRAPLAPLVEAEEANPVLASRRAKMSHSVAVIVARGADI